MPSREQQLFDEADNALRKGEIKQSIGACRALNTEFPEYTQGWRLATQIHLRLGKPEAALVALDRVLSLHADDTDAALKRVDCLLQLERESEAIEALHAAAAHMRGTAEQHDRIGRLYTGLKMHDEALSQFEKACIAEPGNASAIYNVATAQRFLGRLEESEHSLDKALEINPYDFEAQAMRSSLCKQTVDCNHVEMLTSLLTDDRLPARGEANICYALAKEYDDLDAPLKSFRFLERGAAARRIGMEYRVDTDLEIIAAIRDTFDANFFADNHYGDNSDEPIFIIGMPRTGTTLVERIIGSHSEVHAAGELDDFARQMMRQLGEAFDLASMTRIEAVQECAELNLARLGRDYVASTRPETGKTAKFIDKLPFNYLYAGLIRVSLPNAKIINLTRHPMATCYAVFKQFFRDAYPFSYDLEDLARYYIAYHELMTHWHDVVPGEIYSIAYEDVVSGVESEARKLLDFCGLEWEPAVLEFHKSSEASTTASAAQVRQPVYSSSIDRWRSYRDFLQPLESMLNQEGIATK